MRAWRHGCRVTALLLALGVLAGCGGDPGQMPGSRPSVGASGEQETQATALETARRCGTALGLAARCNLVRDAFDFAVLRSRVHDDLQARYGALGISRQLAEAIELATLDRMAAVAACAIPAERAWEVESGFRDVLTDCGVP